MRKVIAVGLMIALATILYLYIGNISENNKIEQDLIDNVLTEDDILLNIETNYAGVIEQMKRLQKSPEQITKFHCMLTQMIYSRELEDDQIASLVKLERETYAQDLLEINPEDLQLEMLFQQLEDYGDYGNNGLKVIAYKTVGAEYYNDVKEYEGKDLAIVKVVYYFNLTNFIKSDEVEDGLDDRAYIGYVLSKNDNELWEVVGFKNIDPFTIIDE